MKYKVVLAFNHSGSAGGVDGAASVSFYTKAQAVSCCEQWRQDANLGAYLWDGNAWTSYLPIP